MVEPWRVAKKVVQPDGQAVSVSRRVVRAVTVKVSGVVVVAGSMLAAAVAIVVVHDEEVEVEIVLEPLLLLLEDAVVLEIPDDAGS